MKIKKFMSVLLTAVLVFIMLPISSLAANEKHPFVVTHSGILWFFYDDVETPPDAYDIPKHVGKDEEVPWFDIKDDITTVVFDKSFADYRPVSTAQWFYGLTKLNKINNIENLNTSDVTDMFAMFCDCESLESIDLSGFDTSNVTDMGNMFDSCNSLETLDVSSFDTSKVTDMSYMFSLSSYSYSYNNGPRQYRGNSLASIKFGDKWNMSNVKNTRGMFCGCFNLTELDVSDWDTSNVTDMGEMFQSCIGLKTLDVSKWNTSNVVSFYSTFDDCQSLESVCVSDWVTHNTTEVNFMFENCMSLKEIDVTGWDTSNIEFLNTLFLGCSQLTSLDLTSFDVSNIKYLNGLFENCTNLKTIYVDESWELSEYGKFGPGTGKDMFRGCFNLVGGAGTKYDDSFYGNSSGQVFDRKFAVIDGGPENPGLLTLACHLFFEGGEGAEGKAPKAVFVLPGDTAQLPSNSFSKDGYKFIGWSDGTKTYSEGDSYTIESSNVTFKAQWEKLPDEPAPSVNPTPTTSVNPVTPTTPAPTKAPELDVGDFVDRCYEVALGRDADDEGFDYWTDALTNGQACGAQVGYGFIFSSEYIMKDNSNEQYVKDLYTMFFDREPDEAGFNYWTEQLKNGTATREEVFAGFANSVEFYDLCLKYGVAAGYYLVGVPNDRQGGINSFVARMYEVCLGRLPDQGGQAGWVLKLHSGEVTGSTCAYGFVFSPEFMGLGLNNTDYVEHMYRAFFGREADEEGLAYWVDKLNAGTADYTGIFNGFSCSAEFVNLCAGYGIQV